jgi:hypothetical protein
VARYLIAKPFVMAAFANKVTEIIEAWCGAQRVAMRPQLWVLAV